MAAGLNRETDGQMILSMVGTGCGQQSWRRRAGQRSLEKPGKETHSRKVGNAPIGWALSLSSVLQTFRKEKVGSPLSSILPS